MAHMERRTPPEAQRLTQQIAALGKMRISVGWFPSAVYPDGAPVAGVMAVQEFGSPKMGIPPRSFMRATSEASATDWANLASMLGARVLAGKMTVAQLAEGLGAQAVGDIQVTISQLSEPALSARTLAARRKRGNSNAKPLVDTRVAFNTLTYTTES